MPLCSHKVDCWALGVTLYCFLYGSLPFFAAEGGMTALLDKIKEANPEYPDGVASTESVDLLKGLMSKDPEARLSLDGALAHPWLAGGVGVCSPLEGGENAEPRLRRGFGLCLWQGECPPCLARATFHPNPAF